MDCNIPLLGPHGPVVLDYPTRSKLHLKDRAFLAEHDVIRTLRQRFPEVNRRLSATDEERVRAGEKKRAKGGGDEMVIGESDPSNQTNHSNRGNPKIKRSQRIETSVRSLLPSRAPSEEMCDGGLRDNHRNKSSCHNKIKVFCLSRSCILEIAIANTIHQFAAVNFLCRTRSTPTHSLEPVAQAVHHCTAVQGLHVIRLGHQSLLEFPRYSD